MVAVPRRRDGAAAGSVTGERVLDRAGHAGSSRPPTPRPRRRRPGRGRRRPGRRRRRPRTGTTPPGEHLDRGLRRRSRPALGEAFAPARRRRAGCSTASSTTTSPPPTSAPSTGLRLRHVQPTGHYGCTGKPTDLSTVGLGRRRHPRLHRRRRRTRWTPSSTRRLGWARAQGRPAGRPLRHGAAADRGRRPDDLPLLDRRRPRRPRRPDGVLQPRRRHPDRRAARPPGRPGVLRPGLPGPGAPRRSSRAGSSNDIESVFDNGLPLGRTDWIERRPAHRAAPDPALRGAHRAAGHAVRRQPGASRSTAPTARSTTWSPAIERGLLLTCLWYIREVDPQTLLLTGLTRDGVYLVEDGEVIGAVNNFRFNESPVDLLGRFTDASATVPSFSREWGDYFPRTATPALRVPDFNMSPGACRRRGQSDASRSVEAASRPSGLDSGDRPTVVRAGWPPGIGARVVRRAGVDERGRPGGSRAVLVAHHPQRLAVVVADGADQARRRGRREPVALRSGAERGATTSPAVPGEPVGGVAPVPRRRARPRPRRARPSPAATRADDGRLELLEGRPAARRAGPRRAGPMVPLVQRDRAGAPDPVDEAGTPGSRASTRCARPASPSRRHQPQAEPVAAARRPPAGRRPARVLISSRVARASTSGWPSTRNSAKAARSATVLHTWPAGAIAPVSWAGSSVERAREVVHASSRCAAGACGR